ncbi:MAG: hypothetical protein EBU72_13635, partial [Betaproteobacteria bacterium]|nr:hypothetical protein [Betaproteobacteria bacterium]
GAINAGQVTLASGSISATLTGSGTLTKSGTGTFTLESANTYAGGTNLSGGKLVAGDVGAFGSGTVNVTAGTLDLGNLAVANNVTLQGGALLNAAEYVGTATVPATKVFTLDTDLGGTLNVLGTVDFTGGSYEGLTGTGLVKRSTGGLVVLSTPTTFAGTFKILAGGSVKITDPAALGTATIALAGGTLDLNGLSISNTITLTGGSTVLNPPADLVLSLANGSYVSTDLAAGVKIGVTSTALLDLTNVTNDIVFQGGTLLNLAGYAGNLTIASGTLAMPATLNFASLTMTGGVADFNGVTSAFPITMKGGALANAAGYSGVLTIAGNVTMAAGGAGLGSLVIDPSGKLTLSTTIANAVTVNGGTLAGGSIALSQVTAQTGTLNSVLTGATALTKNSAGTLTLGGANTFSGGVNVQDGTLAVTNVGAFGSGPVTVSGGVLNLGGLAVTKALNLTGGALAGAGAYAGTATIAAGRAFTLDAALGGTVAVAGTLNTATGAAFTGATVNIAGGATLDATASAGLVFAGNSRLNLTGAAVTGAGNTLTIAPGATLASVNGAVTGNLALAGSFAAALGAPGTLAAPNAAVQLTVDGDLALGGVLSLTNAGAAGAGSYRLLTATGATTGAFASVAVQGINTAALHPAVTTEAGVTRVDLFRVATATGTIPTTVAFGNVRPGAALTSTLTFANGAIADGFSEQVVGTATGPGTGFAAIAPGASGTVTFALDSTLAGAKTGSSAVSIESV